MPPGKVITFFFFLFFFLFFLRLTVKPLPVPDSDLRAPSSREEEDTEFWWKFSSPSSSDADADRVLVPVVDNGEVKDTNLLEKLASFMPLLGGTTEDVSKAFWIKNPELVTLFERCLEEIAVKRQANPTEFDRQEWKEGQGGKQREQIRAHLDSIAEATSSSLSLPSFLSSPVPVIRLVSEGAAARIAKCGFSLSSSSGSGWYGNGIYLTTRMAYAARRAPPPKEGSQPSVFVVGLAIFGNSYPATEPPVLGATSSNSKSLVGKPCLGGYQSHYAAVDEGKKVNDAGLPLKEAPSAISSDELVVFDPSQILPLFVIHSKRRNGMSPPAIPFCLPNI